jgi:hypothetical protein
LAASAIAGVQAVERSQVGGLKTTMALAKYVLRISSVTPMTSVAALYQTGTLLG